MIIELSDESGFSPHNKKRKSMFSFVRVASFVVVLRDLLVD